jgi:hypothetical protein
MNLKKSTALVLLFISASNAWAIGQASTQVLADKIKSVTGSGTVNVNTSGTVTIPNQTGSAIVSGNASIVAADVSASAALTNAQHATMSNNTVKGNVSGGAATPSDLSATQLTTIVNAFTGDSGAGGVKGAVPAPSAGDAAANKVLGAGGGWVTTSTGDFSSNTSTSVDSEFLLFSGTGGKTGKRASGTGIAMGTSGVASFLSGATAGQVPMANGTTFVATTLTQPYTHFNCGLSASISANTVVIDLKQSDGSTAPSASAPCIVGFRSATATSGALQSVSFTAANQVTVGASASLGHTSMTGANIYVYLIQDGTNEICVSNSPFLADDRVHSAVATPSTGGGVLYCTSVHTSRPTHLLGVVKATYSAPNWSAITSVSIAPFAGFDESAMVFSGSWQGTHTYVNAETLLIDTEDQDDFNAFASNTYTVQIPSVCTSSINAAFGSIDGVTDISITNTVCGGGSPVLRRLELCI